MFAFLERLFERVTAPYAQEIGRLSDSAFRALLARI